MFFYKSINSHFVLDKRWRSQRSIRVQVEFTSLSSLTFSLCLSWVGVVYNQKYSWCQCAYFCRNFLWFSLLIQIPTFYIVAFTVLRIRYGLIYLAYVSYSIINLEISIVSGCFSLTTWKENRNLNYKKEQEVRFVISSREHSA